MTLQQRTRNVGGGQGLDSEGVVLADVLARLREVKEGTRSKPGYKLWLFWIIFQSNIAFHNFQTLCSSAGIHTAVI